MKEKKMFLRMLRRAGCKYMLDGQEINCYALSESGKKEVGVVFGFDDRGQLKSRAKWFSQRV